MKQFIYLNHFLRDLIILFNPGISALLQAFFGGEVWLMEFGEISDALIMRILPTYCGF
jgi:hypothetical protein